MELFMDDTSGVVGCVGFNSGYKSYFGWTGLSRFFPGQKCYKTGSRTVCLDKSWTKPASAGAARAVISLLRGIGPVLRIPHQLVNENDSQ